MNKVPGVIVRAFGDTIEEMGLAALDVARAKFGPDAVLQVAEFRVTTARPRTSGVSKAYRATVAVLHLN